ncbi:MAG TPA: hypothetical protein VM901_06065 [Bdellovibrionota bacterium]|jgi:hypothetical protein|nr:hypothetical protein [Bdellovibrionota bacterium]
MIISSFKTLMAASLIMSSAAFAAGTFDCSGKGVKVKGQYGSTFSASLTSIIIEGVGKAEGKEELGESATYVTQKQILAQASVGTEQAVVVTLETVGDSETNEGEPWVYGGIVKTSTSRVVDEKTVTDTKTVPVTCSASF